ncbi:MAG: DnaB-like helicase N-terminal domain-containing protein [Acidobacteriota bacterium]
MSAKDRPLPACLEAERLILGSLLAGDLAYPQARGVVTVADFSVEPHRRVFRAMGELAERGESISRTMVYQHLEQHGQAESCGGLTYLVDLEKDNIPMNLQAYLRSVRDAAVRRRGIAACQVRADELWAGTEPVAEILTRAQGTFADLGRLAQQDGPASEFSAAGDGRYRLTLASIGVAFEVDRLRRDHHELLGELAVRCSLPGARTFDSSLSIADFNLSSARARSERAKLLAARSQASAIDWTGLLEQFCQRVLQADRAGQPAVDLRELPDPGPDDSIKIEGFIFPRRQPAIIFGDGGTAKSYTALYLAGRLAEQGMTVGLFDWELAGDDHRQRLRRLFGLIWPRIVYARCERPLVFEADRLRRIVRESAIDYAVYDSVAFACDGPPEAAEVAARYFQAVRQIGVGSLHVAHVSKADGADQKPFGSAFWHNGARSTWFVKLAEASMDTEVIQVGFFNRKANLGRLSSPVAFTITFTEDQTLFRRIEAADTPDLAVQLTIRQRMAYLLRRGAMTPEAIASEIEADVETVRRTARRYRKLFTVIEGGRFALLERTAS